MTTEIFNDGAWVREQVRTILLEADPSAWRAEREEELRRRVREVVAHLRAAVAERTSEAPATSPNASPFPGAAPGAAQAVSPSSRIRERARGLVAAMERAMPADATRARWAAFVGEVHPAYEALVAALPADVVAVPTVRPTNYTRSAFHFGSALVALTLILVCPTRGWLMTISGAFAVSAWTMEIGRRFSPKMNDVLMRVYGPVAHAHERYRVNSATWYATALILVATLSTRPAMIAGVIVLGVADPIAAFAGRRFGKHKIRAGRSLEGTLAFFASGTLAAAFVLTLSTSLPLPLVVGIAVLSGFVGAIAELVSVRIDDNFSIPVAVAAAATIVSPSLGYVLR